MNRKGFDGKAIYNPQGKAGEYSEWACNFYTGCSNNCDYCYCKKGFMGSTWNEVPQLKKCFMNEADALVVFERELKRNLSALRQSILFFTFTSDPFLLEDGARETHWTAILMALENGVPVQALTKRAEFAFNPYYRKTIEKYKGMIAFGFTLTGHDELEPGASPNKDRIMAMVELHRGGFHTFASIEPVVDFVSSASMINLTMGACDLYKIGLMSGKRYNAEEKQQAIFMLDMLMERTDSRFYLKDSMISFLELDRANLPGQFVGRDYNIFRG